jgi:malonyl-CoA O-methyltransferase
MAREAVDTRTGYDAWAKTYDAIDNPLVAMTDVAMAAWSPRLDGARVLEIGCGTGRNARFFLNAGARYVGLDGSPGMLEVARRQNLDATWFEGDLTQLPRFEAGFDLVFISLVLEHVEALAPALRSARGAARPGGALVILEIHPAHRASGKQANFRDGERELFLPSFEHSLSDYEGALQGAGWALGRATSWYAAEADCGRSQKLRRYLGRPLLLELRATAASCARPPRPGWRGEWAPLARPRANGPGAGPGARAGCGWLAGWPPVLAGEGNERISI